MAEKKPWTVMVYIAADNNLTNFGVDSLKQMKAVGGDQVNIVAEFDTGPARRSRRYLFDGGTRFGSIEQNEVGRFGPFDAGDPANLTAFIEWSAIRFPAERYFLIIWGHGGGVDDAFPNLPNRSFVRRHSLLNLAKGVLDAPQKGVLDAPPKGVLDAPQKAVLDAMESGVLNSLHEFVIRLLKQGVLTALEKHVLQVLSEMDHPQPANGSHRGHQRQGCELSEQVLETIKKEILESLNNEAADTLKHGDLDTVQRRLVTAMHAGAVNALHTGILLELQKEVVATARNNNLQGCHQRIQDFLQKRLLPALVNGVLEALQDGLTDFSPSVKPSKSIAFVDHPESFLTNQGLRQSLEQAQKILGQKIDILGMDACNMNMVEIGYELRDCVRLLVASQDDIPDASWPYDQILAQLVHSPDLLPADLACMTTSTFVSSYRDYIGEPVSLAVMNLDGFQPKPHSKESVLALFSNLREELQAGLKDPDTAQAIADVRSQVRSFGQDEFIDLIDFCRDLALSQVSPQISTAATNLRVGFSPFINCNRVSDGNQIPEEQRQCNGTSIYFPQTNAGRSEHLKKLAEVYKELEFSKRTGWGEFVNSFLAQQQLESAVSQAAASHPAATGGIGETKSKPPDVRPSKQDGKTGANLSDSLQNGHLKSAPALYTGEQQKHLRRPAGNR